MFPAMTSKLKRLHAAATPGPWIRVPSNGGYLVGLERTEKSTKWETTTLNHYGLEVLVADMHNSPPRVPGIYNAELIAHMRNILPDVIALVEAAKDVVGGGGLAANLVLAERLAPFTEE